MRVRQRQKADRQPLFLLRRRWRRRQGRSWRLSAWNTATERDPRIARITGTNSDYRDQLPAVCAEMMEGPGQGYLCRAFRRQMSLPTYCLDPPVLHLLRDTQLRNPPPPRQTTARTWHSPSVVLKMSCMSNAEAGENVAGAVFAPSGVARFPPGLGILRTTQKKAPDWRTSVRPARARQSPVRE